MRLMSILLLIILLYSCEKNSQLRDDIFYSEIIPNKELNSVRAFESPLNPDCKYIPIPFDSLVDYYLDLNNDLVNDFRIIVEHGIYSNDMCGHCAGPFGYFIKIIGLNEAAIAKDSSKIISAFQLDSLQLISKSLSWRSELFLARNGDCPGLIGEITVISKEYIGLKFQNKFAWLRFYPIDNNGIRLIDYAYNNTEGNSIKAGQRE